MLYGDMDLKGLNMEQLKRIIAQTNLQEKAAKQLRKRASQKLRRMCEKTGHQMYRPYEEFSKQVCRVCGIKTYAEQEKARRLA